MQISTSVLSVLIRVTLMPTASTTQHLIPVLVKQDTLEMEQYAQISMNVPVAPTLVTPRRAVTIPTVPMLALATLGIQGMEYRAQILMNVRV